MFRFLVLYVGGSKVVSLRKTNSESGFYHTVRAQCEVFLVLRFVSRLKVVPLRLRVSFSR